MAITYSPSQSWYRTFLAIYITIKYIYKNEFSAQSLNLWLWFAIITNKNTLYI